MPADPETTAAIDKLADRMEAKIDRATETGSKNFDKLEKKIEAHATETRTSLTAFGREMENVTTRFSVHEKHDDDRYKGLINEIKDAKKDRKGLWKMLAGGSLGGGFVAGLIQFFTGKGGSG